MCKVRVLVVDDQAAFRQAAVAVVTAVDEFELVDAVDSGEAAVAAALTLQPDLVLMDVSMPGIGGLEAAQLIAGDARAAHTRILLVSTYDAEDFGEDVELTGADGFLSKTSFDPDRLRAAWLALQ